MRSKRFTTITLVAFLAVALFGWSHARSKAHTVLNRDTSLILPGTLVPMITTAIDVPNLALTVPLNTEVQRGQVIGFATRQVAPDEIERARSELDSANTSVAQAEDNLRQINEELNTRQLQASNMSTQEISAETGELDAQQEFARQEILFRSGLAAELDYEAAASARASAEAALSSLLSNMSTIQIEIDESEAKAEEAKATLADALERRNAAQAFAEPMRGRAKKPVVSPADGIIVASEEPALRSVGIASHPDQLCAYAAVPQADITSIRIGEEALVVLDGQPAVALRGKVDAISETP